MQKKTIVIAVLVIVTVIAIGLVLHQSDNSLSGEGLEQISSGTPSGWQTYTNEAYGFQLSYPASWNVVNGNLDEFSPNFDVQGQTLSFDVGVLDNESKLPAEKWIDQNDFFNLKQYEDPNAYVGHGISDPINITTENGLQVLVYFGGASGGGSTGTAIIPSGEKIIVLAYSLPSYEEREAVEGIFNEIVKTFRFTD